MKGFKYETILENGKEVFRDADGIWCMIVEAQWIPNAVGTWDIDGVTVCTLLDFKRESYLLEEISDFHLCDECRQLLGPDTEAYVETSTGLVLCDAHSSQNDDETTTRVSKEGQNETGK